MAKCELKILGNPTPLGRLRFNDDYGYVSWQFIPLAANNNVREGRAKVFEKHYILVQKTGMHDGKSFGTLLNFSLYNYNKKLTYTFKTDTESFQCTVSPESEFEL